MGSTQSTWGRMGIASLARTNLPQSSIHSAAHSLTVRSKTRCHKSLAKRLWEHSRDSLRVVTISFPAGCFFAPPTMFSGHELCMPRSRLQGSNLARGDFRFNFLRRQSRREETETSVSQSGQILARTRVALAARGSSPPGGRSCPEFFKMTVHAGHDPSVGPPARTNLGPKTSHALMSLL